MLTLHGALLAEELTDAAWMILRDDACTCMCWNLQGWLTTVDQLGGAALCRACIAGHALRAACIATGLL